MNKLIPIFVLAAFCFLFSEAITAQTFAGGTGTVADPYKIETAAQFNEIRNNLDQHFILTKNIDLSGYTPWTPIGKEPNTTTEPINSFTAFSGSIDGNGKVISNITIDYYGNYVGLVGVLGGTIKNLGVKGTCKGHAGNSYALLVGYVGQSDGGTVENCWAEGTVTADGMEITSNGQAGLIAGVNAKAQSIIRYCYAKGKVICQGAYSGGICGRIMNKEAYIYDCFSEADVRSVSTLVGGIVGQAYSNPDKPTVYNNYATGSIKGADMVGGLIGRIYTNSMAKNLVGANDSVIATSPSAQAGRIVGTNSGIIESAYSWDGTKVVSNEVTQTTENSTSSKDGSDNTMTQLKNKDFYTALGWDFANIWAMPADGLPLLANSPDNSTPTSTKSVKSSAIKVFTQGKLLHVKNITGQTTICVFNLKGEKIHKFEADDSDFVTVIPQRGFFIVQVKGQNNTNSQKIYIH